MCYIEAEDFIRESNLIEGITLAPTQEEVEMYKHFMSLTEITIWDLKEFVQVNEPEARLRDCVSVPTPWTQLPGGDTHQYPQSGPDIRDNLQGLLTGIHRGGCWNDAYWTHVCYERLHPFTDCNGRSGRMLWKWMMGDTHTKCFLHTYYYQSLQNSGRPTL